jgi:hypothetical protein
VSGIEPLVFCLLFSPTRRVDFDDELAWLESAAPLHLAQLRRRPFLHLRGAAMMKSGTPQPLSEKDILRAAMIMVERHGSEAAFMAGKRAEDLLSDGEVGGAVTWRRVQEAVTRLQAPKPVRGESIQ